MVPIIQCSVPLAGIVGVSTRMEEKSKGPEGGVGQTVINLVRTEITVIDLYVLDVHMYVYITVFNFITCLSNRKETT